MIQQGHASRLDKKTREFAIATIATQNTSMSCGLPSRSTIKSIFARSLEYCMTIGRAVMGLGSSSLSRRRRHARLAMNRGTLTRLLFLRLSGLRSATYCYSCFYVPNLYGQHLLLISTKYYVKFAV
jgi:hypothetical protein